MTTERHLHADGVDAAVVPDELRVQRGDVDASEEPPVRLGREANRLRAARFRTRPWPDRHAPVDPHGGR
ncbi:hypothetical protein ACFWFZ_03345 [Streptomyces sp. NPDC060232]|uniref:hypothetical protein n=1 Tax=Streptomyces sp. NPDC060232 TaxID=3347079 RepID=UPI003659549A